MEADPVIDAPAELAMSPIVAQSVAIVAVSRVTLPEHRYVIDQPPLSSSERIYWRNK
jgi:hypothetical protein